jgi:hypothetical protein
MMSRASCRLGVPCALVVGASLLGGGVPAGTQGPLPPTDPTAYALLAFDKMEVSRPISLQTGSVGVNDKGGQLDAPLEVPLELNAQDGVIAASNVDLETPSTCAALFANTTPGAQKGCGTVQSPQEFPEGQPPLIPHLRSDPICALPDPFPLCDRDRPIDVNAGSELPPLPPDTYGDLTVNGGTLRLQGGGEYVFCNVTVKNGSQVIAEAPSTLLVADSFTVVNSRIYPDGSPQDLRVLVAGAGDNVVNISAGAPSELVFLDRGAAAGGPVPLASRTCFLRRARLLAGELGTRVVAQLCAPGKRREGRNATLNLFNASILGTFVADRINVGNIGGGNASQPLEQLTK